MDLGLASTIGVAIDSAWVGAVQFDARGRTGRAAVRFRRISPGGALTRAEAQRVLEVLARHGFLGRRMALAAPEDRLVTTTLHLPAGLDEQSLAPVVRMEMARAASSPPDALEAGQLMLAPNPRHKQRRTVHAAALRHEDASALMEPLLEAGADITAIEPAGVAALRAVQPLTATDPDAVTSILEIGWDRAQVIVAKGGAFAYARTDTELALGGLIERTARLAGCAGPVAERAVTCGLEAARPAARRQLEELAQRLGRLAEAAQAYVLQEHQGSRDAGLLVHGPGALIPGLVEAATNGLELPFTRVTPQVVFGLAHNRYTTDPSLIAAAGLAMEPEGRP